MKHLIVNADDFGLTEGVSRGIWEAHQNGIVTSTSLLANGRAFDSALVLSSRAPALGIGVHLNLSEGTPVSPAAEIESLLDRRGQFHLSPLRLWKAIRYRRVRPGEIATELRAQVRKLLDAGVLPTHLDGHMHVHVVPGVAEIVIRLAREFGIAAIRSPAEPVGSILRPLRRPGDLRPARNRRRAVAFAVSLLARRFGKQIARAGLACPAHFYGTSKAGFLDAGCLRDILVSLPDGTSELMCHPGYPDAHLPPNAGSPFLQRDTELLALTSPAIKQLAAAQGIGLITFRGLTASGVKREAAV